MIRDFEISEKVLDDVDILIASYGFYPYEGDAFVLFKKNGKLYEVNGSHCSCYGLEGQWDPEEVNVLELFHRAEKGNVFDKDFHGELLKDELLKILKSL